MSTENDYLELEIWELIGLVLANNPHARNRKEISREFKVSTSTVSRWADNPKIDGIELSLTDLARLQRFTGDQRIKEWVDNFFKVHGA